MTLTDSLDTEVTVPEHASERADRGWILDLVLALILTGAVFVVHNVGYMLSHPFWVDEAWVADSTRAPFGLLPWLTSSTPLGWTVLLRVIPAHGGQDLRLLPLFFSALAVFLAYYVGRELPLPRYLGGLLTGSAVLLVPAMLVRDDLKQYTAEACVSVAIVLLVARIENRWTRGRLLALVVVASAGLLIANTSVFVGIASTVALAFAAAWERDLRHLVEASVALLATVALSGLIYVGVDKRHVIPGLTAFWDGYYVPRHQGLEPAWSFLRVRLEGLAPYLGSGRLWLDAVLLLGGIVGLCWMQRIAVALIVPFTLIMVVAASAVRFYPFGDLRTSTFWLVLVALDIAVGVGCVIRLVAGRSRLVATVATAVILGLAVVVVHPSLRSQPIPNEDVRSQVAYVIAHRRPGDVVIVDFSASWGFAYYDRSLTPDFVHIDYATTGFLPTFPGVEWLVQMHNRTASDVTDALATAESRLAGQGGADSGRIWIIRTHMDPIEGAAWGEALAGRDVRSIDVGPEPLLVVEPTS